MSAFADALAEAGGAAAPRERAGQLRALLEKELDRGAAELSKPRSGYGDPITTVIAAVAGTGLVAAAPVPASLRADPQAAEANEDAVLASLGADEHQSTRPHDDPDPARRAARRILQRLAGMGKWGGYHTEFSHLARGFAGNERALAEDVGEQLLRSGLLLEKPSVGQRHVFLNPRRAADIYALIDHGTAPKDLNL